MDFDVYQTKHGEVLVQKLKCDNNEGIVFFLLRETLKGMPPPKAIVRKECNLTLEFGGKSFSLGAGDVAYYASNQSLVVINIKLPNDNVLDAHLFDQLIPLMESLALKSSHLDK